MHILHPSIVLLPTRTPSTHRHGTHTLARHRLQILAIQRLLDHRDRTLQTPSPRRRTHPRAPCSTRWASKPRPRSAGSVRGRRQGRFDRHGGRQGDLGEGLRARGEAFASSVGQQACVFDIRPSFRVRGRCFSGSACLRVSVAGVA